ncbi:MAG TPA: phosphate ABC transporter permease subunit PstC [Bryobacteraceae bacterium]|nr:phosphate ABC transporter permease subunit PstC [Bryobacteraceae bacterium]
MSAQTQISQPLAAAAPISQPPSRLQQITDLVFRRLCLGFAWLCLALVVYIVLKIALAAAPAVNQYGTGFFSGTAWDANRGRYSILPEIWGTMYSSILALIFGTAFGLAAAIFLSEGFLSSVVFGVLKSVGAQFHPLWGKIPEQAENLLRNLIELLAAIPSVVYGLWGLFVVIPLIRPLCHSLYVKFAWLPLFGTDLSGPGMLPAAIVLSIMVLPTITAISRDALTSVPPKLRLAAYGLGATRWETITAVIVPTASRGIFGGVVLAFGRALGETMALAMLVGNANKISVSLFSPANTLAALLANNFPEAKPQDVAVLMYAALVLLAITLLVNIAGAFILQRASRGLEGGKA